MLPSLGMAQGLDISYHTIKLNPDDGLSQGSNYFRYEDSKGFMWITGNDALNRYDGSMVKVYNLDKYFKDCPNLQQGYGFAEDDSSNLYAGSVRGLYKYIRNEEKFILINIFPGDSDKVAMPFAFKKGKVWCFNKNYELAAYDVKTGKVSLVTKVNLQPLKSIHVYDIQDNVFYYRLPFFDVENNIWLIGKDEVCRYESSTKTISYPLGNYFKDKNLQIYCSTFDKETNAILFGTNDGIVSYSITTNTFKQIKYLGGNYLGLVQNICTGQRFFAAKSWSLQKNFFTDKQLDKIFWIEDPSINSAATFRYDFDKSGRLWMCNDGQGQFILDFKPLLLNKLPNDNTQTQKLIFRGVSTFAEFGDNDILIQYDFIMGKNGITLFQCPGKKSIITDFRTVSAYGGKGVWLYLSILNKYSSALNKFSAFYFVGNNKQASLFCRFTGKNMPGQINDFMVYDNQRLLCSFSTGLYWFNTFTKELEKIKGQPVGNNFKINKLSNNRIAVSFLNSNMRLAQINKDYTIHFTDEILPGVQSFYVAEDEARKLYWLATNNGVYLLDHRFKTIEKFDANSGLAGTYMYGLLLDEDGSAWCSHQRGISSISSADHKIINYNKEDGIQDWDFNNRSFYKATDGTLYFGGVSGFNYFKPPIQPSHFYQPEIYIDEIKVNGQTYLPDSNATYINDMHLNASQNNITIHAIVKDLENAKSYTIVYGLGNFSGGSLTNNGTINFANLAPGDYTLKIAIKNRFFTQPQFPKTIHIHIALPFYRTVWFAVLLSFAFSALLFVIYIKRKQSKQRMIAQQQAALDQQRHAFTADLHDDIGASLSSLQLNSAIAAQVFDKNPQQSKEMLQKVEGQSQQLAEKIGDFIWSMKPRQDEFMTLSSRIKTYTSEILGATAISHQLKIDSNIDQAIVDFSLRKNLLLIVKEALNNAAKYSKANNVLIEMKIENNQIILQISDDGVGLPEQNKPGNGLKNMRTRTEEMKGVFTIETGLQKGVVILVSIPCP